MISERYRVTLFLVKALSFREIKNQEAARRVNSARQARRSMQTARLLQQRASLVGGAKWRITNLAQVATAMARWA